METTSYSILFLQRKCNPVPSSWDHHTLPWRRRWSVMLITHCTLLVIYEQEIHHFTFTETTLCSVELLTTHRDVLYFAARHTEAWSLQQAAQTCTNLAAPHHIREKITPKSRGLFLLLNYASGRGLAAVAHVPSDQMFAVAQLFIYLFFKIKEAKLIVLNFLLLLSFFLQLICSTNKITYNLIIFDICHYLVV